MSTKRGKHLNIGPNKLVNSHEPILTKIPQDERNNRNSCKNAINNRSNKIKCLCENCECKKSSRSAC